MTEIRVDNDRRGSGYSEEPAANWESRNVNACAGTYRYLSRLVGDGSRRGRAIWQPAIPIEGSYAVEISYRATENRSNAARYVLIDDLGGRREHIEDQTNGDACVRVDLGELFCRPGGQCRVVVEGNDGQSVSADETTFRLRRCEGAPEPPPPGPCDGIRNTPGYEVCEEAPTRCAGVFSNGAGCNAFCAAAGMRCTARTGGEPGCRPEPANILGCDDDNGHASDWCVCEGMPPPPPPPQDAASPPPPPPPVDAAVPDPERVDAAVLLPDPEEGLDASTADLGTAPLDAAVASPPRDAGTPGSTPVPPSPGDARVGPVEAPSDDASENTYSAACSARPGAHAPMGLALLLLSAVGVAGRKRRRTGGNRLFLF